LARAPKRAKGLRRIAKAIGWKKRKRGGAHSIRTLKAIRGVYSPVSPGRACVLAVNGSEEREAYEWFAYEVPQRSHFAPEQK